MEQLGNSETDVRMGALYSLERICRDSRRDKFQIIQIIAAYVRGRASALEEGIKELQYRQRGMLTTQTLSRSPEDIQVALDILGRRDDEGGRKFGIGAVDLSCTWLSGARLRSAEFSGDDFRFANLENARFEGCQLTHTDFRDAILTDASFLACDLTHAKFMNADLRGCIFSDSVVVSPQFRIDNDGKPFLDGVDFSYADLTDASFLTRDLSGVTGLRRLQLAKARPLPKGTLLPQDLFFWDLVLDGEDPDMQIRFSEADF